MKARGLMIVEIDRVGYVVTPTELHPDIGGRAVILARRDGSEAVVLLHKAGNWYCSCRSARASSGRCRHLQALKNLGAIATGQAEPPPRPQSPVQVVPRLPAQEVPQLPLHDADYHYHQAKRQGLVATLLNFIKGQ